jgi:hypothetical protein
LRKADNDALLAPFDPALLSWRLTARRRMSFSRY